MLCQPTHLSIILLAMPLHQFLHGHCPTKKGWAEEASFKRGKKCLHLSDVSPAPTAKATLEKFMDDLQGTVDEILPSNVLLLLGNFSARVGMW